MNWGNKLLVAFVGFAGGMSFLVYKSVKTNFELVEKDYYKNEIAYQQVIDGSNRANKLSSGLEVKQDEGQVILQLSPEMKDKMISGSVWFYCSYDQTKDRKFQLQPEAATAAMLVPGTITPGNYTIKIKWSCESKDYYLEKFVTIL